jgi:hypothetical protein
MATEPLDTIRNAAAKLAPEHAQILPNAEAQSVPLTNAKEVRVAWAYSTDDNYAELEQFLSRYTWPTNSDKKEGQRYVDSPVIGGTPLPGRWRQAFISRIERRGEDRQPEFLIVLTLRRGWSESIDWTEALLVSRKDADGNSVSVPSVNDTESYNDAAAVVVRFPNISPYKIRKCMAEFADSTFTDPKVQGDAILGTWHKAFVSGRVVEDGSGVVELVLSRERFTVRLYQNYGTVTQASVYKLYGVTRDIAQAIVTSWQDEGRSADISLSSDSELCVVTLTDRDAAKDNLSTSWIKDACDKFIRYHFAWGYTKAELDAWIKAHDGTLNSPAVSGDEGADTQPISRRLSVRERGDGLFNAEIEERKFDNSDPTNPDYSITIPTGLTTTRVQEYGWNLKASEVSASDLQDRYDLIAKEIGLTVQFEITRRDDCSFDYRAVLTRVSTTSSDLSSGDLGITTKVIVGKHLDGTGEKAAVEALAVSGPRKRVSLDLDIADDDSKRYKATVQQVVETEGSALSTTGAGIQTSIVAHKNRDVGDVADLGSSGIRERVSASLQVGDDGTQDITIQKQTLVETNDYTKATTGAGVQISVTAHKNVDPADIADLGAAGIRERVSASVSPNDDGSIDATIQKQTVVETNSDHDNGTFAEQGIFTKLFFGNNADAGDLPTIAVGYRKRHSISIQASDDGSLAYSISEQQVAKLEDIFDIDASGATGIGRKVYSGTNVAPSELDAVIAGLTPSATVEYDLSVQGKDDGTIDYTVREITKKDPSGTYNVGSKGETVTIVVARNKASLADPATPTTRGVTKLLQPVLADDGSISYELRTVTQAEVEATTKGGSILTAETRKHVRGGTTEVDWDASAAVVEGTAIRWELELQQDGSVRYVKTTDVAAERVAPAGATTLKAVNLLPSRDRFGYQDTLIHFENVARADLGTYFVYTGTTYGRVEQFRINPSGKYSGEAVTRTYNSEGGGWWGALSPPDDDEYYLWDLMWDTRADDDGNSMTGYWIILYTIAEAWHTDFADAAAFILNGLQPTFTTKEYVSGKEIWHSKRTEAIAISDRISGTDTAILDLPGDFVAAMTINAPVIVTA